MTYLIAVCSDREQRTEALVLAIRLRRIGLTTELYLSSKAKKQFKKAEKAGANEILTVEKDKVVWYRTCCHTVDTTVDEVVAYHEWVNDDYDELPDPDDRLLVQNCLIGGPPDEGEEE